jgi:hypothetical protein
MRRLVLKIILRLGRYAVLPVVALACVILALTAPEPVAAAATAGLTREHDPDSPISVMPTFPGSTRFAHPPSISFSHAMPQKTSPPVSTRTGGRRRRPGLPSAGERRHHRYFTTPLPAWLRVT